MQIGPFLVNDKKELMILLDARIQNLKGALRELGMEIKTAVEAKETPSCLDYIPYKLKSSILGFWARTA